MDTNDNYNRDEDHLRSLDALDKWELENEDQDVRGCMLVRPDGMRIGRIEQMLVDRERERVAGVRLEDGQVFPVEPLTRRDGVVVYGEELRTAGSDRREGSLERKETIPLVEEKLHVGKRLIENGCVRVRSRVVEEPITKTVTLRDEEINIERRPVSGRVENAAGLFEERDIRMTATDEKAVVEKVARVKEEVVVRKDVDERVERISDTVRKTEVDVDRDPGRQ